MEKETYLKRRKGEVFIGIDLHKGFWVVSAIVEEEYIFKSVRLPGSLDHFLHWLEQFKAWPRHHLHLVYEAGCFGFWICQELVARGYDCRITPPSLIPVEEGNHVKTDARDSQKLARYLSKGLLREVHVPVEEVVTDRDLLRTRTQLVRQRATIELQIKAKLLMHGKQNWLPAASGRWTERSVSALRAQLEGTPLEILLSSFLNVRQFIIEECRRLEVKIRELARKEDYAPVVKILSSAYGIGPLTAITLWLEAGANIARFKNSRQWSAYLGLTPSEYSSGENTRRGHITRCGNARIRSLLVENSWVAIRYDRSLKKCYEKLRKRCGGKKAIVAVARKFACRLRQMLLKQEEYRMAA